jgi:N-acetylglucosamine-6-sulfatase
MMGSIRRNFRALRATLAVALLLPAAVALHPRTAAAGGKPTLPPNIVLILTDDQRWDTLWAMPHVRELLADRGVEFTNAFVSNSLCCPSRTSILTGKYSHSTGVYTNAYPYGGYHVFDDSSTVATWLHGAGYRTGLIGKYLNQYKGTTSIPPGWDRWFAFEGTGYYNYKVNDDGVMRSFGDTPDDYSTDVLARQAVDFVKQGNGPFFLYFAPYGPHGPAKPAPADQSAFSDLEPWRPPSYNEVDVSQKPDWVKSLPRLGARRRQHLDDLRVNQYRSLQAVDRSVAALVDALSQRGELDSTMFVFMSDNGFSWGEHRWVGKQAPYEESIRVPMVIRYDPLTQQPSTDSHLVLNIDLAPTWAALAGVDAPGAEGASLVPLLASEPGPWRHEFLLEHLVNSATPIPTYCGVRTEDHVYVAYGDGEQELYDVSADPYERTNQAGAPSAAGTISTLRADLAELCNPPPPGYSLSP